jgi:hypothetical protein
MAWAQPVLVEWGNSPHAESTLNSNGPHLNEVEYKEQLKDLSAE